nr:helix-turn-helix domain-containing protein [uncultured Nevskia sp.]
MGRQRYAKSMPDATQAQPQLDLLQVLLQRVLIEAPTLKVASGRPPAGCLLLIAHALTRTGGNRAGTARRLGIHRQLLYRKMAQYGLD